MDSAPPTETPVLLLFGASGAIGGEIEQYFLQQAWRIVRVGRPPGEPRKGAAPADIMYDVRQAADPTAFAAFGPYDAVCWAHGANLNDSCYDVDRDAHLGLYEANCLSLVMSLQLLLRHHLLKPKARLCVISSIWQERSRQNKLSYSMTKSALRGFVLSAAADLAQDGFLINAILPGVLETPMTRSNLNPEQIDRVEKSTLFGSLTELRDVAFAVWSVLHPDNRSMTGQFIKIDRGFSDVRII